MISLIGLSLFLLSIAVLYALFTLTLWLAWLRMPTRPTHFTPTGDAGPTMTVVIPVRNEGTNIGALLDDLARQTYRRFEVIVADDQSTDNTRTIVQERSLRVPYPLYLLLLADERTASPKKRAISQSIARATGTLIVTTDGDCRAGPNWLAAIAQFYQQTGAKLISGPVTFTAERTGFDALQTVEFASLIGAGAATLALGRPTMCNGANLCYERTVFTEVGGFAGVDHLASGDDELLMHKIAHRYPAGIRFLKSADAIVQTGPHNRWRDFYNQRKRWASKWRTYDSWMPTALAVFVFLSNAAPLVALMGWWFGWISGNTAFIVIGTKFVAEFLFLGAVLRFLGKASVIAFIPLAQVLYPFYAVFFGIVAQGNGYYWKGRKLN